MAKNAPRGTARSVDLYASVPAGTEKRVMTGMQTGLDASMARSPAAGFQAYTARGWAVLENMRPVMERPVMGPPALESPAITREVPQNDRETNDKETTEETASLPHYASVASMVALRQPEDPVHVLRPSVLRAAAAFFLKNFPGHTLFAVKVNPHPFVLKTLFAAGIRRFDAASLAEIALVAEHCPGARIYFMHPVKSRAAIRKAYQDYGVRDFVLDSASELFKILEETGQTSRGQSSDLTLHVRLALPKGEAFHALDTKFGATPEAAAGLLRDAARVARRVGLCFHVGSQMMEPLAYRRALKQAGEVIAQAGVKLHALDVGGGFPVAYPGLTPPPMQDFMQAIREGLRDLKLPRSVEILCEPGRALVAEAGSLIVKVELRKEQALYVNDGIYGSLFDSMTGLNYPARLIRPRGRAPKKELKDYLLYGPTCDSLDIMKGPWPLPADTKEGDWLEIGQLGAYGMAMQSRFNGFFADTLVTVEDAPQLKTAGYWE